MRKILLLLLLMALPLVSKAQDEMETDSLPTTNTVKLTAPGSICPDFELKDYKGNVWKLGNFDGKVLVIDFWATWCGACIANLPAYVELASQYKDNDKIQFITISIDSRGAEKHWKYSLPRYKLMGLVNLICSDKESKFAKAFNVRGVPRYVIIGPDRKIINDDANTPHDGLKEQIENVLSNL